MPIGFPNVPQTVFVPSAMTGAAIAAAGAQAYAAGGGIVKLMAGVYSVSAPIPLYSGVIYEGTGAGFNQVHGSTPHGTILYGNTGIDCFYYNSTDAGSAPTVYTTFMNAMLQGGGVRGMTIQNFNHAIKVGGLWNAGCQFSEFKDLYSKNCNWGFWFENFIECNFEGLMCLDSAQGNGWFMGSGGSALNNGNSTFRKLFAENGSGLTRNWVFGARGVGTTTAINDLTVLSIQTNGARVSISQAATMSNTSANISITDSTKFVVDMPVSVSSSANGFVAGQIYFITSIVGNVITLSDTMGGNSISATGSTATNIITYGFPQIEIVGYGSNIVQPCDFIDCDLEGGGAARLIMQNCRDVRAKIMYLEGANITGAQLVLRGSSNCEVSSCANGNSGLTTDFDGSSYNSRVFGPRYETTSKQAPNSGLGYTNFTGTDARVSTNTGCLYLSRSYGPDFTVNKNGNFIDMASMGIGFRSVTFASGGTIYSSRTSLQVYSGAGGGNATLPTIVANGDGLMMIISNPSSGTLTINTSSSQTINGSGTSYVMPANSTHIFAACNNGGTLYWAVT
jgi:hypothetical protein